MTKLKQRDDGTGHFFCPGCGQHHTVGLAPPQTVIWGYNGNPDCPTLTPSVLTSGNKLILDENQQWNGGWQRDAEGNTIRYSCHSFVTDGNIQFLSDCSHELAGQTVPLPDIAEPRADDVALCLRGR